ncbi:MAG: CGGC domain-containing protein [Planctomycetota bacterium]|jgi:predicted metal-binding protein
MTNVAVLYCKKIKDRSCIACAKCYKAMAEGNGEYGRHDTLELVGMTDCGDCPGLTVPRVKLLNEVTTNLGRPIDVLMETAQCPINFDEMKATLEGKFGLEVVLGTHSY